MPPLLWPLVLTGEERWLEQAGIRPAKGMLMLLLTRGLCDQVRAPCPGSLPGPCGSPCPQLCQVCGSGSLRACQLCCLHGRAPARKPSLRSVCSGIRAAPLETVGRHGSPAGKALWGELSADIWAGRAVPGPEGLIQAGPAQTRRCCSCLRGPS